MGGQSNTDTASTCSHIERWNAMLRQIKEGEINGLIKGSIEYWALLWIIRLVRYTPICILSHCVIKLKRPTMPTRLTERIIRNWFVILLVAYVGIALSIPSIWNHIVIRYIVIALVIALGAWRLAEIILYHTAVNFCYAYPEYKIRVESVNRSVILLIINYCEMIMIYSLFYLISQSICNGISGRIVGGILDPIYFSIVTIATLGFGDFYPVNAWGKVIVCFEVLSGVLLVVLIISMFFQRFGSRQENSTKRSRG